MSIISISLKIHRHNQYIMTAVSNIETSAVYLKNISGKEYTNTTLF